MGVTLEGSLKLNDKFTSVLKTIDNSIQKTAKTMQDFKQKVSSPIAAFQKLGAKAQEALNRLNSQVSSKMGQVVSKIQSSVTRIISLFGNFGNRISSALGLEKVVSKFSSAFSSIKSKVSNIATSIGTTLGTMKTKISSAFSSAVSSVRSSVSKMVTILKSAGSAFKQFGSEMKNSFSQMGSAVSPITSKIGKAIKYTAVAGAASLAMLAKKVYDVAGGFEEQMSRVKAISGATGDAFTKLRQQAIDLGAKTAFSATESAAGMENLASAGFDAKEIMSAMPGLLDLAAVSGGDVAMASENAATALRGFGLNANQAGHVANVFARAAADTNAEVADMGEAMKYIAPVANSMGISIEETAAAIGIMSDAGVKGSQAGTTLRGALSRLARPTKAMTGSMKELGISFYDSKGKMLPLNQQIGKLKKATAGLTQEERNRHLVTLYGQESLSGMLALVKKGPDELNKLTKSLKNSNGAAQTMAEEMQNNLPAKMEQLGGAFESAFIRIGDAIFPTVGPMVERFTDFIDRTFSKDNLSSFFEKLSSYGRVLKDAFNDVKGPVGAAAGAIKKSIEKITGAFGSTKSVNGFKEMLSSVTNGITAIAGFAERHSDAIAKLIVSLPKLMLAFAGFKIAKGVIGTLSAFGGGLLNAGKAAKNLVSNLKGLKKIPKMPKTSKQTGSGSGDGGNPISGLLDSFSGFAKAGAGLALVFAGVKIVEEMAQAIQDINKKVPNNLAAFIPKLVNMSLAIVAMGGLIAVAGKLAASNPVAAIAGLAAIAGISLELMLAAEALKQINDKVPSNIGDMAKKMANIGLAIAGMSALVGILGTFIASGIGAIVAGGGLLAVAAVAGDLMLVAEAVQQVNNKVPSDLSSVKNKIDVIAEVIQHFSTSHLGNVIDIFKNAMGLVNTAVVGAGLKKIEDIANSLKAFEKIEIPKGVAQKIQSIQEIIKSIDGAGLAGLIETSIATVDFYVVKEAFDKLADIGNSLGQLESVDFDQSLVKGKVEKVQGMIDFLADSKGIFSRLKSLVSNTIDSGAFNQANAAFRQLVSIGNSLVSLENIDFNTGSVKKKVKAINDVIDTIGKSNLVELVEGMIKSAQLSRASASLEALKSLEVPINKLASGDIKNEDATTKLQKIVGVLKGLKGSGLSDDNIISPETIMKAKSTLDGINTLKNAVNKLATDELQVDAAKQKVGQIRDLLLELSNLGNGGSAVAVVAITTMIATISSSLSQLNATLTVNLTGIGAMFQAAFANLGTIATTSMAAVTTAGIVGMSMLNLAFTTGMTTATTTVTTNGALMVAALTALNPQMFSAGNFAMQGLTAGIQAGAASAVAAAKSVALTIAETVRSAMDINSPSRVMMALGNYISMGLANGILAAQSLVARASNALVSAVMPNDVDVNGTMSNSVSLDDSEVSRLKASANQQVIVKNKQLSPQITLNYTGTGNNEQDAEALFELFEQRIDEFLDVAVD